MREEREKQKTLLTTYLRETRSFLVLAFGDR
jgi:hypothetical protein